jgi:glycosyltransferase involved in cell wall biosynthesis
MKLWPFQQAVTDISIIIPTFNRAELLEGALNSIVTVIASTDAVEIVIVDNGSLDKTASVVREMGSKFPRYEWRYFYEPIPGLLSGRHRGMEEARGEILSFLDDDVLLTPSWPSALQDAFRDPRIVLVGGPSRPLYEVGPPDWLEDLWEEADGHRMLPFLSLITSGPVAAIIDPLFVFGLNFSIRKSALQACAGFHPDCIQPELQRYQGDGETGLARKIKAAGLLALHHPGVAVIHVIPAHRLSLESFELRAFYQGVCDSYTRIRLGGVVGRSSTKSSEGGLTALMKKLRGFRRNDIDIVRTCLDLAHAAGIAFHDNEVRGDPDLLRWVTKPHYFDYTLPDGWKRYLKSP